MCVNVSVCQLVISLCYSVSLCLIVCLCVCQYISVCLCMSLCVTVCVICQVKSSKELLEEARAIASADVKKHGGKKPKTVSMSDSTDDERVGSGQTVTDRLTGLRLTYFG